MRTRSVLAVLCALSLAATVLAQPADNPPGGRPGGGRFGGMRDPLRETVVALGDLNLQPDFTLSAEQKTKIQAIRDDMKKQMEKWRSDHADDFRKLREQQRGYRDRESRQEMMKEWQDLMATAPKSDEAVKQLKAVLTEEQQKQLDEKIKEMEENRPGGFGPGGPDGGGRGGRGGRGGGD